MKITYHKVFIGIFGTFLVIAMIASNIPLVSGFIFILRHVSYFLTLLTLGVYIIYWVHRYLVKKFTSVKKVRLIKMTSLASIILMSIGIAWLQNQIITTPNLIPKSCIYYDQQGNIIYRSVLQYGACDDPQVISTDINHTTYLFYDTIQSESSWQDHPEIDDRMTFNHQTTKKIYHEISMGYDESLNLTHYVVKETYHDFMQYRDVYYHRVQMYYFVMNQNFEPMHMTSEQHRYMMHQYYETSEQPWVELVRFEDVDFETNYIENYELMFLQLTNQIDIQLHKTINYPDSSFRKESFYGYAELHEKGYNFEMSTHDVQGHVRIDVMRSKSHSTLHQTTNIANLQKMELVYQNKDDAYRLRSIDTVGRSFSHHLNYIYGPNQKGLTVVAITPDDTYMQIKNTTYGKKTIIMAPYESIRTKPVYDYDFTSIYDHFEYTYRIDYRSPYAYPHPIDTYLSKLNS